MPFPAVEIISSSVRSGSIAASHLELASVRCREILEPEIVKTCGRNRCPIRADVGSSSASGVFGSFFSAVPGASPRSTAKKNDLDFTRRNRRTRRRAIFHVGLSIDGSMETGNVTRVFSTAVVRGGSLGRPECALSRRSLESRFIP